MSSNNMEIINQWTKHIKNENTPIFIHSYASTPTGIRNQTEEAARHEAVRIAFNRGLIAKSYLVQCGINKNRLILSATASAPPHANDSLTITTRSDGSERH